MLANVDDLGKLMTAEQGKPLAEAKGEVAQPAILPWRGNRVAINSFGLFRRFS
jgi:acyl-CoA reductase-like NAD-dependent aldehyde dehydrogenase